ncbi:MAG: hypothetical protein PHH17_00515 [Candidatus Pacebacteria bacterium]|nr:hypothetical protein [Candidatus Paceibacterota bacterium]MDD3072182.1 hypothetical protein [Candidatus Paceibacterota bacterium]MDD4201388.1 hypothetical protein [Candidatus Paceibacterota bacterium]MDD4897521.1 hypothetical protein [Candidatus Paceibacterota bacterium]MDD5445683.1 hypothetical protein [Candidatus Paceibacterota bacterium]
MKKRIQILSFFIFFVLFFPFSGFAAETINLPFLGEVNLFQFSLPVLSIVLGTIDGLNVCSIGALVLILSIVLVFKKRSSILFFGGLFLFVVSIVYGILVMFWYQVFSFILPFFTYMRAAISAISFFGGIYFFKEFLRLRKGLTCTMSNNKLVEKTVKHLQESFSSKKSFFALVLSVIFFAAVVTIIEFPCSAAIPVVFTSILAEKGVGILGYLFYILLYLFFYLLDEIVVFLVAVFTKKIWFREGKFITYATLAGSLVLFFIAYYYAFL